MPEILRRRLATLADEAPAPVDVRRAVSIGAPPSDPRVSFPLPELTPPFAVLDRAALAAALGCDLAASRAVISERRDLSSAPGGVCRVTVGVVGRWNAHAGAHADQPAHWLAHPPLARFDDRQYTGEAHLLDLTPELDARAAGHREHAGAGSAERAIGKGAGASAGQPGASAGAALPGASAGAALPGASAGAAQPDASAGAAHRRAITARVIEETAADAGIDLSRVRRLLIRTYEAYPTAWDPAYAAFTPEAARLLARLPRLVLLGTDAPSVDPPDAAPIAACAHGALWESRIAILEGLDYSTLPPGAASGVIQTTWNPMQRHPDALGCTVLWHPA